MHATDRAARIAGAVYLSMALTAPFSLIYVPRTLIVPGNPAATADRVLASEALFRAGIVASLAGSIIFVLLAIALMRLLGGVGKALAALMVGLVLVSVAIGFVNELNSIAALTLFRGADFLAAFDEPQREALGMLFLRLHAQGNFVNEMLWGLWLLPFGVLVIRSRFLPRILGVLLIVNCFAYVVTSLTWLLVPGYGGAVFRAVQPALLGELWIALWLVLKGANVRQLAPAAGA
jgi:hypothetical protein